MWNVIETHKCGLEGVFGPFTSLSDAIAFVERVQFIGGEDNLKSITIERE